MLRLYNCTGSYIVKYRQSIAFGNIYIGGHFLGSREGRKNVAQVAVCCLSEHHAVFIGCQSALSALLPRTRDRSNVILGKRARVVCSVSSYNLCSTAENNRQE